jgi:hypothetical protein
MQSDFLERESSEIRNACVQNKSQQLSDNTAMVYFNNDG